MKYEPGFYVIEYEEKWVIMWIPREGLEFYSTKFDTEEEARQKRLDMYMWHTKRRGLSFELQELDNEGDDE